MFQLSWCFGVVIVSAWLRFWRFQCFGVIDVFACTIFWHGWYLDTVEFSARMMIGMVEFFRRFRYLWVRSRIKMLNINLTHFKNKIHAHLIVNVLKVSSWPIRLLAPSKFWCSRFFRSLKEFHLPAHLMFNFDRCYLQFETFLFL